MQSVHKHQSGNTKFVWGQDSLELGGERQLRAVSPVCVGGLAAVDQATRQLPSLPLWTQTSLRQKCTPRHATDINSELTSALKTAGRQPDTAVTPKYWVAEA